MAKPSWGKKLKCQSCGAVYYDMTVEKPVCPKCETIYLPIVKRRRGAPIPATVPKKPAVLVMGDEESSASEAVVIDEDDDLEAPLDDDDDDEGLIEDTSDLDDDDDDMAEIKEHVETDLDN